MSKAQWGNSIAPRKPQDGSSEPHRAPGSAREFQRVAESPRRTQRAPQNFQAFPGSSREAQRGKERPIEPQRAPENSRELQSAPESPGEPTEAQKVPESSRELQRAVFGGGWQTSFSTPLAQKLPILGGGGYH